MSPKNILEIHVSHCAGISSTCIPSVVVTRSISKIISTRLVGNFSTWWGRSQRPPPDEKTVPLSSMGYRLLAMLGKLEGVLGFKQLMGSNPEPGTSHVTLAQLLTFSVPLFVTPWQNDRMLSALCMRTVPGHTASEWQS